MAGSWSCSAMRVPWPRALRDPCEATIIVRNLSSMRRAAMSQALFALTDEQRAIQETAYRFATDRLAPGYQERDKAGTFDRALVREMGALGLIGVDLPEIYGGLSASGVTAGLVIEQIAHADL